ncbi:MAG: ABC transporter permease subunit [Gammaproteobacteria bacterium]|nr:ABC transporter permease subunit [Gammaproteobacteria bacterium]
MLRPFVYPILRLRPNRWDLLALPLVAGFIFFLAWAGEQAKVPYVAGVPLTVSLVPSVLPGYALRTVLRMAAALCMSIVFTLTYATLAAKSKRAERLLIPLLDVLQSVPILGFLSITVTGFMALFPGHALGLELAATFAIFTSQAWNMAFSFYQSLCTLPKELRETAAVFHLSPWQKFWKLELPYAMPGLIWNAMMSVSGGWFFLVASEAITVSGHTIMLPGIGSYIALAIAQKNLHAISYAIMTMFVVILIYDQLLFRPLLAWADKFKFEQTEGKDVPRSWVLTLTQRTRLLRRLLTVPALVWEMSLGWFPARANKYRLHLALPAFLHHWQDRLWNGVIVLGAGVALISIVQLVHAHVGWGEVAYVFGLGLITAARVIILTLLASLVWVPVGVWIGLHPRWAERIQPLAQFLAAFPANLLFPLAVVFIVRYHLNVEIWTSPLMILGTQWYILFNVIAGAAAVPSELKEAARSFGLRGRLWWRNLVLPGIFPAYVTGAITASGGAWNASIVAEVVSWGHTTLIATGLGAYITEWTGRGDLPRIALGISVMSIYVVAFNRLLWRRLYTLAQQRLHLE